MTETVSAETAAVGGKPAALWEDFVDVFTNPSAVFARRRDGAYAGGITLLASISALVFVATRAFWQPFFEHQFQAVFAAQQAAGKLTAEQVEQMRGAAEKFAGVSTWLGGILGTPFTVMLLALVVMGAAHLVGAKLNYGQSLVAATLAHVPRVLAFVVGAGVLAVKDPASLPLGAMPTSPAALLPSNASQIAVGLLNRLDPFVLWGTLLIGIGVAVLGRVERGKGYRAAAMVWGLATLFAVFSALRAAAAAAG